MIALLLLLVLVLLSLWLLRDRKQLVGEVVARTLYSCGTTLIIDEGSVTLLAILIDCSLDVFAEVFRVMAKEQRMTGQAGEDKLEGGRCTESARLSTISLFSSSDGSLDPPVEDEPSMGSEKSMDPPVEAEPILASEKTMNRPMTGCRLYKTHKERKPGEEPTAAPLSHRAARKAKKATSKAALVSNVSTAEGASTFVETTKKVAKRGRDARKKDPAPPAVGSDYSDNSVVAGSSKIKPAISSKPGTEAKANDMTAKALNQANNPSTRMSRQLYPPELESIYKKVRRDQKWTGLAKQLKAALVNAKSSKEKMVIATKMHDLVDEKQAEVGGDEPPVAPRGLEWKLASTFEIQAPTREDKVVGRAVRASMESKASKELEVGDHYDFSGSAQRWWDRHRPSTDVQKSLESSTIEALDLYGDHVRKLMQCRAHLDLRRRALSAASSRLGSASITLQCLVRQGIYRTNFWRSQQESAEKGVRQVTKALRKARTSEAQVVSTVSRRTAATGTHCELMV